MTNDVSNQILHELTRLNGQVSGIESQLKEVTGDVKSLKADVKDLKEDVAVLKEDVKVLKVDVTVLKEDVKVLKVDVDTLKADVKLLKETAATKKDIEEFPAVKSVIYDIGDKLTEVDSSIKRMELSQEKYENRLDLLSIRSLDQEAEIKSIKHLVKN